MSTTARNRNNRARGAHVERLVARMLGGIRTGGDRGGQAGDVQTVGSVYEVKSRRQQTPALIRGAWAQLMQAAERSGKDPGGVVLAYTPGAGKPREFWLITKLEEAHASPVEEGGE